MKKIILISYFSLLVWSCGKKEEPANITKADKNFIGFYKGFGPGRNIEFKSNGTVVISWDSPGDPVITATTNWNVKEDKICFESNDNFVQLAIEAEDLFEHFNSDMCVKYTYDTDIDKFSNEEEPQLTLYLINEGEEYMLNLKVDHYP